MDKTYDYLIEVNGEYWCMDDESPALETYYKIEKILYNENSPFQHIMVVESYGFDKMLILDGAIQTTVRDGFIYNEMISHIPMNIHPQVESVLIIGGGDCGAANEIAKYDNVKKIDMVEIDQMVVEASLKYLPEISAGIPSSKINFIFDDGIKFVEQVKKSGDFYDLVIIDSSDPVGPALPLFNLEFYKSIHCILKEDGLMVCQSMSPLFYADIVKYIYESLNSLFPIVKPYTTIVPTYPGGIWLFILASKKYRDPRPLEFNVKEKKTNFVNREILESCFSLPEFLRKDFFPQK